ncbi:MAG: hypothetical protein IJZ39_07795 [Oscillospiraceae bacterium]|nr:hypothetical protein [Oscillospiraceae bacterium]
MNIRKNIDYSEMYAALDAAMATGKEQMELYTLIGQAVCRRTEKGAAVAAAEYLRKRYSDVQGFSPRNLRRMRDFCRTYENHPVLLSLAMNLSWTQNVVIMEADLTMELREWYLRAARQFGWSKTELTARIAELAHLEIVLDIEQEVCDNGTNEAETISGSIRNAVAYFNQHVEQRVLLLRQCRGRPKRGGVPWRTMWWPMSMAKQIASMRC